VAQACVLAVLTITRLSLTVLPDGNVGIVFIIVLTCNLLCFEDSSFLTLMLLMVLHLVELFRELFVLVVKISDLRL